MTEEELIKLSAIVASKIAESNPKLTVIVYVGIPSEGKNGLSANVSGKYLTRLLNTIARRIKS